MRLKYEKVIQNCKARHDCHLSSPNERNIVTAAVEM